MNRLTTTLEEIRSCRLCASQLAAGPRPLLQCSVGASILIAGQAPGRRAHASGIPFDDASGDRLRQWMGIERDLFYDPERIAIIPMSFCYPGSTTRGDQPPRPECAQAWRAPLLRQLPRLQLTLVLGRYAQAWHFGDGTASLTERVKRWRNCWPGLVPLPHPSPRNNPWLRKNPWFEATLLPELRARIAAILSKSTGNTRP